MRIFNVAEVTSTKSSSTSPSSTRRTQPSAPKKSTPPKASKPAPSSAPKVNTKDVSKVSKEGSSAPVKDQAAATMAKGLGDNFSAPSEKATRTTAEAAVAGGIGAPAAANKLAPPLPGPPSADGLRIADHVMSPGQIGKPSKGISGGHPTDNFADTLRQGKGVESAPRTPSSELKGLERAQYQLPKADGSGLTGAKPKTLVDPKVWSRDQIAQLADKGLARLPAGERSGHVKFGKEHLFVVRPDAANPGTLGIDNAAGAKNAQVKHNIPTVEGKASDLHGLPGKEQTGLQRAAGTLSKGLGGLGLGAGVMQAANGAQNLGKAENASQVVNAGADLLGGTANAGSGASMLAGASKLAGRLGGAGAIFDGGRDLYNGLSGDKVDLEKSGVGLAKTAAGVAMMIPGGALIGGGLYLGAMAYENREAIGQLASSGWNKLKSLF